MIKKFEIIRLKMLNIQRINNNTSVPSVLTPTMNGIALVQTLLVVVPAASANKLPQNLSRVVESGPGHEPPL